MHTTRYLAETAAICTQLDATLVEALANELATLRHRHGRLYVLGLGGGAANASHATNDFRKLCQIDAQCLTDNVAELTARANDDGWMNAFLLHFARAGDALFVFSVGGGTEAFSKPIVQAIDQAKKKEMRVLGIVGRDGGETRRRGDCVIVVPTVSTDRITPHTEAFQLVILHCLVSHPLLQRKATTW